jgi:hypothetical protein
VTAVRSKLALASALGALALLGACGGTAGTPGAGAPEDQGDVSLALSVHAVLGAATPIPVGAVWVHLHGTSARGKPLDVWSLAQPSGGRYTLTFSKIAVGSYLAGGRAYASATATPAAVPDFESVADIPVTVTAKAQSAAVVTLQQNLALHPPARTDDRAPTVDSLVASAQRVDSSDPAATIALTATASDPDGPADLASFAWTAVYAPPLAAGAAPGVFGAAAALATSWTPPAGYEGIVTVAFAATDLAGARAALSVPIDVSPRNGAGAAAFTLDVNSFPDLGPVLASAGQPKPGERVALSIIARDADGDLLAFAWDDGGCGGAFDAQGAATTTWTAPMTPAACTLAASASDGRGGTNRSTLTVTVTDRAGAFHPEFILAAQSPGNPVPAAGPVWFRVEAVEPTADPTAPRPVTDLAWSSPAGGVFAPVVAGDLSSVLWTPAACLTSGVTVAASVTVTATGSALDLLGNACRNAFTFAVDVVCP